MSATKDRGAARAGQHIQAMRDSRRWSQADLANAITLAMRGQGAVSQTTVSSWELGESVPNRKKWPAIERALDMEPGELDRFYVPALSHDRELTDRVEALAQFLATDRMLDRDGRAVIMLLYRRLVGD